MFFSKAEYDTQERLIEPLGVLENDFKQYEKLVEQSLDLGQCKLIIVYEALSCY